MYELKIKADFSAAHNLRGYKGVCEDLHGHNWHIEVYVQSSVLNNIGLLLDFKDLKGYTNEVLDTLDHKYLNDLESFKEINPSSENIAKYIYDELTGKVNTEDIKITKVTVYESKSSSASFIG